MFNKPFSQKDNTDFEMVKTTKVGCIGEAEKIANVVSAGLEKENYSGMNEQLSVIAKNNEKKDVYVFEHSGVVSRYYAIALIIVISLCFMYCLFIGVSTVYLSSDNELNKLGLFYIVISSVVLLVNIVLSAKLISTIRFKKRFDVYKEWLGYKSLEYVEDLALCTKLKETLVIKDMRRATKFKLIPQGHFSKENRVFMVSNDVYNRYMEQPAVYDCYFQKVIEKRKRVKSRTRRINQIIEIGEQYIQKIHEYENLIKEKDISKKIDRIKHVVFMIFHEMDNNPNVAHALGEFLNYYLPTTEKLLDAYIKIEGKQVFGKSLTRIRKEIEKSINITIEVFEDILVKLYKEYEIDSVRIEVSMEQE